MDRRTFMEVAAGAMFLRPSDLIPVPDMIRIPQDFTSFLIKGNHFFFATSNGRKVSIHKSCPVKLAEECLSAFLGRKVQFVIVHPAPKKKGK